MIAIENNSVVFKDPLIYMKEPSFLLDYIYAFIKHSRENQIALKCDEEFFSFVKSHNYVLRHHKRRESFCHKMNYYMFTEKMSGKEFVVMMGILNNLEILEHILPEFSIAKNIGQDKKNSDNLYWHIMKLLEIVPENGIYRWSAILHDLGKYYTEKIEEKGKHYFFHEYVSYLLAKDILYRFKVQEQDKQRILDIVRFHMLPLNYQRNPYWSIDAFKRYIDKCQNSSLDVALFAIHDKRSSNENQSYLAPLYEFYSKVKTLMEDGKVTLVSEGIIK
jgi:hypothetical protein